jgi:hypothetical protein
VPLEKKVSVKLTDDFRDGVRTVVVERDRLFFSRRRWRIVGFLGYGAGRGGIDNFP